MAINWLQKVVFPVKRVWIAISTKVKASDSNKDGGGLLKLHKEVQTCGDEDVQVMWEMMLLRSEKKKVLHLGHRRPSSKRRNKIWRLLTWCRHKTNRVIH